MRSERAGTLLVLTAVSGIEAVQLRSDGSPAKNLGVDAVLVLAKGKRDRGDLPGYVWKCALGNSGGEETLYFATGYPSPFQGDGVYAVKLRDFLRGKPRAQRILKGHFHDVAVVNGELLAGDLDGGLRVVDLSTGEERVEMRGSPVLRVEVTGHAVFLGVYEGEEFFFKSDAYRWKGGMAVYRRGSSRPLLRDVVDFRSSENGRKLYAILKNGNFVALEVEKDGGTRIIVRVPTGLKTPSALALSETADAVFVGSIEEGVLSAKLSRLLSGRGVFTPVHEGLPTRKVREMLVVGRTLYVGTQGLAVWGLKF